MSKFDVKIAHWQVDLPESGAAKIKALLELGYSIQGSGSYGYDGQRYAAVPRITGYMGFAVMVRPISDDEDQTAQTE